MEESGKTIRIFSSEMKSEFVRILQKVGFSEIKAEQCSDIFTDNSLEGVYSHGVNRFARFINDIKSGTVIPDAVPTAVTQTGSLEQWDGNSGPGPLNAMFATDRAIFLSQKSNIGLVALANTNHWMRGGTYGWQAARKGFVFIGWTNTEANMPAWGAGDYRLGNNPLVIAVPFENEAIVLDFAMTQFSYGKMESYKIENKKLPYPGGFNMRGILTEDPGEILETRMALPVGYWKGAGLSLLLDIIAVILSGGLSAHEISQLSTESGLSQIFMAINISNLKNFPSIDNSIDQIITDLKRSVPLNDSTIIRYPGENIIKIRKDNQLNGIPVNRDIWEKVLSL